jgi:hypothetical protein
MIGSPGASYPTAAPIAGDEGRVPDRGELDEDRPVRNRSATAPAPEGEAGLAGPSGAVRLTIRDRWQVGDGRDLGVPADERGEHSGRRRYPPPGRRSSSAAPSTTSRWSGRGSSKSLSRREPADTGVAPSGGSPLSNARVDRRPRSGAVPAAARAA